MSDKIAFSDMSLRSLEPGMYVDTKLPAFGILVGKRRRTFFLRRDNTRVTIGHFPAMSLQDARKKAFQLKGTSLGHAVKTLTFLDAADIYLAAQQQNLRPRSFYQVKRELIKLRSLNEKKLTEIATQDIMDIIDKKKPAAKNNMFRHAHAFFRFCQRRRLIERSPLELMQMPSKRTPRSRMLSDIEVKKIWDACNDMDAFGTLVQVCFLTGQRVGQFTDPSRFTLKGDLLTFPAEIMKSNREHTIPISSLTKSLLPKLVKIRDRAKMKKRLVQKCKVTNFVIHDARRYFSSTHAQLQTPIDVTEALLAHLSGSRSAIQRTYDVFDRLEPKREAMKKYDARLRTLCVA